MRTEHFYMIITIFCLIGGFIIGTYYPNQELLDHKYNEGYGDALFWSIQDKYNWSNNTYYNFNTPYTGYNYTYYTYELNSPIRYNNIASSLSNCTQNETGYNSNDLVMHLTCKGVS